MIRAVVSKLIFSYLAEHAVDGEQYETLRLRSIQNTRNNDNKCQCYTYFTNCSGERTVSHDSWGQADKFILDKVLTDERSAAYASTIEDINIWWLECKECNWYKSKQTILTEARLRI